MSDLLDAILRGDDPIHVVRPSSTPYLAVCAPTRAQRTVGRYLGTYEPLSAWISKMRRRKMEQLRWDWVQGDA